MLHAAVGEDRAVAGVEVPAADQLVGVELGAEQDRLDDRRSSSGSIAGISRSITLRVRVAVVAHPGDRFRRAARGIDDEVRALRDDAEAQALVLADRVAVLERPGHRLGRKVRRRRDELRDVAVLQRRGARHAVDRGVRVRVREAVLLRVAAGDELQRDALARAHEVRVHEAAVQHERLRLRVADAAAELARQSLLRC